MQMARFLKPCFLIPLLVASFAFCGSSFGQDEEQDDPVMESGINFFLDLAQSQNIEGIVVDMQKFKITTGFGDVEVPLDKIDGIRLNAMDDGSAVMAFKNGDILTGNLHLSDLKIKTSWGFATVNVAYIDQISTVKGSTFSSSTVGGKRNWTFNRGTGR